MTKNNPKILTHFLARKVFVQTLAMSRSLSIEIAESAEELRKMMDDQTRAKFRERLQVLY